MSGLVGRGPEPLVHGLLSISTWTDWLFCLL